MKKKMHLLIVVILALTLVWQPAAGQTNTSPVPTTVYLPLTLAAQPEAVQVKAAPALTGIWEAIDLDGSVIRLSIGGPAQGVYQIAWTESYFSFCEGGPGLAGGTATLDSADPNLLVGQISLTCLASGQKVDFVETWVYDPGTDTLSTEEITWRRPNAKTCIAHLPGLTSWWPGDGSPADIASGMNAILGGDANFASGLVNRAFLLDGEGDYVEVAYHPALTLGRHDFTVNLWVNFKSLAGEQILAEQWDQSGGPRGWTLTKLNDNILRLALGDGTGTEFDLNSAPLPLRTQSWYHIAAVREGSTMHLYLNSMIIAQAHGVEPMNLNNPASFKLGHRGDPDQPENRYHFLNGRIDEAQLYLGTALSSDQIKAIFKAGAGGQCKDAVEPAPPFLYPMIWADPLAEYINGWGWPEGNLIQIEVYDGDEQIYANHQETRPDTGVGFALRDVGLDLHTGHLVVLRDGAFEKTLVLTNLDITSLDLLTLTAAGAYDPGYSFYIRFDGEDPAWLDLDESGVWTAPFEAYHTSMEMAQTDEDGDMTGTGQDIPNPYMVIFPHFDFMDGFNWPPGSTVEITVSAKPQCSLSRSVDFPDGHPWNTFFNGNFPEGCDVEIGDTVTMQVDEIQRTHTVYNLHLTAWDEGASILSGEAFPGAEVYVWGPDTPAVLAAMDENGEWLADLSAYSLPQTEYCIRAQITAPDGSATAADWCVWPQQQPAFVVFPEWEWMDGFNWELDVPVSITVAGKQECDISHTPWGDPWSTFFNGPFGEGCDITYGDEVTLTQGDYSTTHTVRYLEVSSFSTLLNQVSGWADASAEVIVWRHESEAVMATAGLDGFWTASFPETYDLQPGHCGRAEIRDEAGNATDVEWCVPNPVIVAQITDDWFEGRRFSPASQISYTVFDPASGVELSGTITADAYGNAGVYIGGDLDLVPGLVITMNDGATTKTLVVEDFSFYFINTGTGEVSGWAPLLSDESRAVWVGYGAADSGDNLLLYTDSKGYWSGSFGGSLPSDIHWIAAQIFDEDGDASELRPEQIYP
jgi:hypothetical protein